MVVPFLMPRRRCLEMSCSGSSGSISGSSSSSPTTIASSSTSVASVGVVGFLFFVGLSGVGGFLFFALVYLSFFCGDPVALPLRVLRRATWSSVSEEEEVFDSDDMPIWRSFKGVHTNSTVNCCCFYTQDTVFPAPASRTIQ